MYTLDLGSIHNAAADTLRPEGLEGNGVVRAFLLLCCDMVINLAASCDVAPYGIWHIHLRGCMNFSDVLRGCS